MNYGSFSQINDSKGPIIISTFLAVISLMIFQFVPNDLLKIIISFFLFSFTYYLATKLFRIQELDKLFLKIKQAIWKRK